MTLRKSRIIFLGRLDPQVETYRTDAPMTSWVAVLIAATTAVNMGWSTIAQSSIGVKYPGSGVHNTGTCVGSAAACSGRENFWAGPTGDRDDKFVDAW